MRVTYTVADPAGNLTALVDTPVLPAQYARVANALMALPGGIEQVGFITPARAGGAARLAMMGGEFCGNAARSFGLYMARQLGHTGAACVAVEITGHGGVLAVECDVAAETARAAMPLPLCLDTLCVDGVGEMRCVVFEGIAHAVHEGDAYPAAVVRRVVRAALLRYSALDAVGVMALAGDGASLTPAVYVCATDSLVYERSCGSGSVAAAVCLHAQGRLRAAGGTAHTALVQPGGVIDVTLRVADGRVRGAWIGGRVTLSAQRGAVLALPAPDRL